MKKGQAPKIQAIIKTYLILTGPKTSKEIYDFIANNDFRLGKSGITHQELATLLKGSWVTTDILHGLKKTNTKPKKYYFPGRGNFPTNGS